MNKLKYIGIIILSACLMASCQKSEEDPAVKVEKVSFTLSGDAPVVAYPEDNVHYNLTLSHSAGMKSASVYLDGAQIEGSETVYEGAPLEVTYSFSYTMLSEQVGQTVDFVFTAESADGTVSTTDYPVYVKSISEVINVILPEEIPEEIIVGESVEFDIIVETGYNIARIRTLKNNEEIVSLTKTSGFEEPKMDTYHFSYLAETADGGSTITFTFEGSDVKGNFGTADYRLMVRKGEPKQLYSEVFNTSMTISNTTAFNTTEGGISGTSATEFVTGTVAKYNGDMPEVTEGVKEGMTVYDGDNTAVNYECDGTNLCLSKYDYSAMSLISGTYAWARKAANGWLNISGIRLHGCTDLTLSYLQCGGSVKVTYSIDGEEWTDICATNSTAQQKATFTVPAGTEDIQIRFTENGGGAHLRFDDISLIGE